MAKRRRRYGQTSLTPAIVVLNILIVLVMGLLVFFVYRYITTEPETALRNLPSPPPPLETITESMAEASSEATESHSISITKASTTTPVTISDDTLAVHAEMGYDSSFFKDSLFIGDSIMTGFSGFGYLPNEIVFAKIGLNPESVLTDEINGKTAAGTVSDLLPDRIYIMLGTNGLSYMSGDYMARQMGILIDELKNASGDSAIVIMSIPPVTREHEQNKPEENIDKINLYNDLLKTLSEENDCLFVDINGLLRDSDGYLRSEYAENDGLHFLPAAYKAVLSTLQTELGLN